MSLGPGEIGRKIAFYLLSEVRRTGFRQEVRDITHVMSDRAALMDFRSKAVAELLARAARTEHYAGDADATDFADFPILVKARIQEDPESFRSVLEPNEDLVPVSTSGSYGTPLTLQLTRRKKIRQQAEVSYFGAWAGYRIGMKHLYARALNQKSARTLWMQNEYFSVTDSPTIEWLDEQVDLLRLNRVKAVIGFPSPIALIAHRAMERGLGPEDFSVHGVITSGESLREEHRRAVTTTFGAPCLSRYASEELGVISSECPEANIHHVNESGYIVEILALDADKPAKRGELGRIVVTDLFSHAMPLIRYDTGDLGVSGDPCRCGRPTATLERIEGRTVEVVTNVKGEPLTPFFINPIMKDVHGVQQFQFAQTGPRSYALRVVGGGSEDLADAEASLEKKLGEGARLEVTHVESIPTLASGKRPYVVNEWRRRGESD